MGVHPYTLRRRACKLPAHVGRWKMLLASSPNTGEWRLPPEVIAERIDQGYGACVLTEDLVSCEVLTDVTINAQTMKSRIKKDAYAAQLNKRRCRIAGIQEARTKAASVKTIGTYFVVSSAAENGNYGCQVWISKLLYFGTARGSVVKVKVRVLPLKFPPRGC